MYPVNDKDSFLDKRALGDGSVTNLNGVWYWRFDLKEAEPGEPSYASGFAPTREFAIRMMNYAADLMGHE